MSIAEICYCPDCGQQVNFNDKFCAKCGCKFTPDYQPTYDNQFIKSTGCSLNTGYFMLSNQLLKLTITPPQALYAIFDNYYNRIKKELCVFHCKHMKFNIIAFLDTIVDFAASNAVINRAFINISFKMWLKARYFVCTKKTEKRTDEKNKFYIKAISSNLQYGDWIKNKKSDYNSNMLLKIIAVFGDLIFYTKKRNTAIKDSFFYIMTKIGNIALELYSKIYFIKLEYVKNYRTNILPFVMQAIGPRSFFDFKNQDPISYFIKEKRAFHEWTYKMATKVLSEAKQNNTISQNYKTIDFIEEKQLDYSNKFFCPKCGEEVEKDDLYCINCGYDFTNKQPLSAEMQKSPLEKELDATYNKIIDLLSKISISNNPEFETLPVMYVVGDYAAASSDKNRQEFSRKILNWMQPKIQSTGYSDDDFFTRVRLYGEIIRGKKLIGSWTMGAEYKFEDNPILRCTVAFGDILINPQCADDYDNCSLTVHNISCLFNFSAKMIDVGNTLISFFKFIYDLK